SLARIQRPDGWPDLRPDDRAWHGGERIADVPAFFPADASNLRRRNRAPLWSLADGRPGRIRDRTGRSSAQAARVLPDAGDRMPGSFDAASLRLGLGGLQPRGFDGSQVRAVGDDDRHAGDVVRAVQDRRGAIEAHLRVMN